VLGHLSLFSIIPLDSDHWEGFKLHTVHDLMALVIDALRHAGVPLADIRTFLRQPTRDQLGVWARQLETDANHRQQALVLARQLLAADEDASFPIADPRSKERPMTTLRTAVVLTSGSCVRTT